MAVVLNNHVFVEPTDGAEPVDGLKAYARPVGYWDERGLKEQFARINDNLRREADSSRLKGVTESFSGLTTYFGQPRFLPSIADSRKRENGAFSIGRRGNPRVT